MVYKLIFSVTAACLISVWTITTSHASTLLGTATLNSIDDLTVIQTGDGIVQEWLDVTVTQGMTTAAAVTTHMADGFHLASSSEVSDMFDAFSFPAFTAPLPDTSFTLPITFEETVIFNTYFGNTIDAGAQAMLAMFDNPNDPNGNSTYACLGGACVGTAFIRSWQNLVDPSIGVFLVRDASVVPIPAALWLFGSGLIGYRIS